MTNTATGLTILDHFPVPASGEPFYSQTVSTIGYSQDISIQVYNTGSGTPQVYVLGSNSPSTSDAWTDVSAGGVAVATQGSTWSGYFFVLPAGKCHAIKVAITTNGTGPVITAIVSRGFAQAPPASAVPPAVFSTGAQ